MKTNNEWSVKNERRATMKGAPDSSLRRTYRDGRKNRRELANKGAFGNLDGRAYNLCAMGTNSSVTKKSDD